MPHRLIQPTKWGQESARRALLDLHREERPLEISNDSAEVFSRRMFSTDPGSGELSDRSEFRERLKRALATLPWQDREVLVMRHIEQVGTVRIASVLGITEEAVKARLLRALDRLRALMESEP